MQRESNDVLRELTREITKLTLALRLQQEWKERAQLPPDFLAMADRLETNRH
jgi:hypothetical protein